MTACTAAGNAPEDAVDETSEDHLTGDKKFRSTGDRDMDIHERREEFSKEEFQPSTSDNEESKNLQPNGSSAVAAELSAEELEQVTEVNFNRQYSALVSSSSSSYSSSRVPLYTLNKLIAI